MQPLNYLISQLKFVELLFQKSTRSLLIKWTGVFS